jgi:hypothetical protein
LRVIPGSALDVRLVRCKARARSLKVDCYRELRLVRLSIDGGRFRARIEVAAKAAGLPAVRRQVANVARTSAAAGVVASVGGSRPDRAERRGG